MSQRAPAWLKPLADYGPLGAFLVGYFLADLMTATVCLMAATAVATVALFAIERRIPWMPLVTALIVGIFGGLTLWLQDETFIKMKPTIVQALFAAVLLGGLLFGRALLQPVLGAAWTLSAAGWRKITFRYGVFFAAMAVLNEIVWRTQSTDFWVNFKVFGLLGLTLLFSLAQTPMILRETRAAEARDKSGPNGGASA